MFEITMVICYKSYGKPKYYTALYDWTTGEAALQTWNALDYSVTDNL